MIDAKIIQDQEDLPVGIFGGIIRCTWSRCTFNSTTSHPAYPQKAWIPASAASRTLPVKMRYLYFGTHTMWCWQCHIACDNLRNLLTASSLLL